jgi:hypothetical protein
MGIGRKKPSGLPRKKPAPLPGRKLPPKKNKEKNKKKKQQHASAMIRRVRQRRSAMTGLVLVLFLIMKKNMRHVA